MKYCPYCGVAQTGGAVSYCEECGYEIKPLENETPVEPGLIRKTKRTKKKSKSRLRKHVREPVAELIVDEYNGYYDDVQPIDSGRIHDRMDPELIKRVIIIAAGAVLIIILSVLLVFLL